ncbi:MAG: SUMF1/EgtB/PvdO family nonheme iron enzyme [Spirosomataceae bacterium]
MLKASNLFFLLLLLNIGPAFAQKGMKPVIPAGTERRLALVVGNKDYQKMNPLRNPLNDANDMTVALEQLGFEVIKTTNADYRAFLNAVNRFKDRLSTSDVALFYYSGHGLSYGGKNYLMPTDADISCLDQIEEYGISLNRILGDITAKGVKNSFVLLDACRNVPNLKVCDNTKKEVSVNNGLVKPTNNPRGSMIVYATEEGSTADDNVSEKNGLFTSALLKYLTRPNLGIRSMLDQTTMEVERRSNGSQSPGRYDKLQGDFVFVQTGEPIAKTEPYTPPKREEPAKPAVDLEPVAMRYVAGGSFEMGSNENDDEKPIHRVTVNSFRMATYETTVAEFERFVEATGYQTDAEKGDGSYVWNASVSKFETRAGINWRYGAEGTIQSNKQHPVIHVSWNDAVAYCEWLTRNTGKTYRLPTEAEWEYAAGNGSTHHKYSWGNDEPSSKAVGNIADSKAKSRFNFSWALDTYDDGYATTSPVGTYAANGYGLHDMSGNVWEWCSDWYDKTYYTNSPGSNPTGAATGPIRVLRGGSWNGDPANSRVANRSTGAPSYRSYFVGFRVVSLR